MNCMGRRVARVTCDEVDSVQCHLEPQFARPDDLEAALSEQTRYLVAEFLSVGFDAEKCNDDFSTRAGGQGCAKTFDLFVGQATRRRETG